MKATIQEIIIPPNPNDVAKRAIDTKQSEMIDVIQLGSPISRSQQNETKKVAMPKAVRAADIRNPCTNEQTQRRASAPLLPVRKATINVNATQSGHATSVCWIE
jgi:hypothetical protein